MSMISFLNVFAGFVTHSTSFPIKLIIIVWYQSIIFSEMEPKGLKSELLFEDSGHKMCHCCFSLNIFSNHFDYQRATGVARGRAHACECAGLIFSYYFLNIKNHICCYVVVIYIVKVFLMRLANILNDENILECIEYYRLLKYSVTEVRKVGLNWYLI